jgi:hypothetical protein
VTVVPVPLIVPTLLLPLRTPSTVQVTAVFDVFSTVAANCCVPFVSMFAVLGLMLTATAGAGAGVTLELVAVLAEVEGDPDPQAKKQSVRKVVRNRERCCFIPGNGDPQAADSR